MVKCQWCHPEALTKWGAKAKISQKCSSRIVFLKRLLKQFRLRTIACFLTARLEVPLLRKVPILKICWQIKKNMLKDLKGKLINRLTLNYLELELSSHSCAIDQDSQTNAVSLSLFILTVNRWVRTMLAWMLKEATWIQINRKRSSMIVLIIRLKKKMPKTIHHISMRMI